MRFLKKLDISRESQVSAQEDIMVCPEAYSVTHLKVKDIARWLEELGVFCGGVVSKFSTIVECEASGYYAASVPELLGGHTQPRRLIS